MSSAILRKFLITITVSLLVVTGTSFPSKGASIFDLLPDGPATPGYLGFTFEENRPGLGQLVSTISSNIVRKDKNEVPGMYLCASMDDPECTKGGAISAQLVLPPCATAAQRMCIEALALGSGTSPLEKALLEREIAGPRTPADPITGLPAGGGPSLWSAPSITNKAGTKTYGVSVKVMYFQNREGVGTASKRNAAISLQSMRIDVFPVEVIAGDYSPLETYAAVNPDGGATYGVRPSGKSQSSYSDAAWLDNGSYGKYADFAQDTRAALTLRMGSEMTGWLYGRLKDVKVEVTPLDNKFNTITIEGAPVAAPGAYGVIKKSELKNYPAIDSRVRLGSNDFGYNELVNTPGTRGLGYSPVGNFTDFAAFEPILKTMPGAKSQWLIQSGASANGYQPQVTSKCFQDKSKLLGIVTTNALIYENGAPEFKDGTLNYKVAGLHHLADGVTLTRGTYDLAIRSETARCVYGFTDAPFQASISVIGSDGQEQTIATESVREDAKREWLFLSAQNFTFSSPVIKVKLTQEKKITETVAKPKVGAKISPAKKSISCIKGKAIKKVTGTSPKCPSGYKKR
jgi:hypothetical protein